MPIERGKYRCTLKDSATRPFLALEPIGEELRATKGKNLYIELEPKTTFEQAQALARELDRYIVLLALEDRDSP